MLEDIKAIGPKAIFFSDVLEYYQDLDATLKLVDLDDLVVYYGMVPIIPFPP